MVHPLDWLLDRSIVFSFDRHGYERHARRFTDTLPSLAGQTALVTGANSGLGYATALELARAGATVHLLCRDPGRGQSALEAMQRELPAADLTLELLDVSRLTEVRRYVERAPTRVDMLVHNAGILPHALALTEEGLESTWATNLIGPYLLTEGLRPRLVRGARVVQVSSGGMYAQKLDLSDRNYAARPFDGVKAYANTKRAAVVLNELWAEADPERHYAATHPGWADTPSVRVALPRFYRWTKAILRTPAQGADTTSWLAAAARGPSGKFWFDRALAPTHLYPGTVEDPATRAELQKVIEADAAR